MPTRIIREGILTSERVNQLSESAELFYRRLMSVVDDYGRYFAHPALLRAACYPLQLNRVREASIERFLLECEKARLVRLYCDNGSKYLVVLNFRQQVRGVSKFPSEPMEVVETNLLSNCLATAVQTDSKFGLDPTTPTPKDRGSGGKEIRPSWDEVSEFCSTRGIPNSDAEWFFHKCEGNGWMNGGKPIKRWTSTLIAWRSAGYLPSQKQVSESTKQFRL